MPRAELKMQKHIVDSYKIRGGYASKWVDEHAKGKPDLVCSLSGVGVHLVEVKHRPEWDPSKVGGVKNPLEPKQIHEAKSVMSAGGLFSAALVVGGGKSVSDAWLGYFSPLSEVWYFNGSTLWVAWDRIHKFDVNKLLRDYGAYDE